MAIIWKFIIFKQEKMILYSAGFSSFSRHFFSKGFNFFSLKKKERNKDFRENATKMLK